MSVQRGATGKVTAIKEVTAGTTPATPVMIELPTSGFTPKHTNTVIASDTIRTHPFKDQMSVGRLVHEFGLDFELEGATHDMLIETMFGSVIATKAMNFVDAVKSLTIEETVAAGVFNQFTFGCFSSMSITAQAGDTKPVKFSLSGMARTGTLDAASTIATSVTAASFVPPYTFAGATLTIGGSGTAIGSATLNFARALDPLMVLGSSLPREFVPGEVTLTGTSTLPYDASGTASGATISTILSGFTDATQVFKFADASNTVYRQFTMAKTKFTSLGRSLSDRGARMQEVNWEAYYDGAATICALATN